MASIIEQIKQKVKQNKKKIIFPESMDKRILEATKKIQEEDFADIILIGEKDKINRLNKEIDLNKTDVINPKTSNLTERFIDELYELRKEKGLSREEAKELLLNDYMYFACMLVKKGYADGIVSGAIHSTSNTLRPALQILKTSPNTDLVSAFFLMIVPNCKYGYNGTFIFADCGLVQNPTADELATIAISSSKSFKLLTNSIPKVAMLSHSTKGSAKHQDIEKVIKATAIAKNKAPNIEIDGELQLDAAIIPEIAETKAPNSNVAGQANVLIFPDLDAGNIGYKLVQRLAKAESYGPITQGISKPVNDLSRGCNVNDIVGVVAITALQANETKS